MTESEVIVEGDRVRCDNPESFRYGQSGVVVEVVEKPVYRYREIDGRTEKVLVSGDPMLEGPSFAWVRYADGIRTPHDLDRLILEEDS